MTDKRVNAKVWDEVPTMKQLSGASLVASFVPFVHGIRHLLTAVLVQVPSTSSGQSSIPHWCRNGWKQLTAQRSAQPITHASDSPIPHPISHRHTHARTSRRMQVESSYIMGFCTAFHGYVHVPSRFLHYFQGLTAI